MKIYNGIYYAVIKNYDQGYVDIPVWVIAFHHDFSKSPKPMGRKPLVNIGKEVSNPTVKLTSSCHMRYCEA